MELQRLSRRVSELVFDRQEFEYNCRQKDLRNAEQMQSVKTFDQRGYPGNSTETHKHSISRHGIQARLDNEFHSQLHRVKAAVEAEAANAELRAQLDALQRDLKASEERMEQHGRRSQLLEQSLSRMQHEMKGTQLELADAVAGRSAVSAQGDSLEAELCALTASRSELEQRLSASIAAAANAKEAEAANAELRAQLDALQRDLQSAVDLNDSHAAEIARVIQLRLEESRSALLESQEAATSFQQYSDMAETRFHALQQNLCDALQQSKKAAAEADMHNAELRAQLKAMQCAKAVPAPAPSAVDAAAEALASKEAKRKEIEARVAAAREKLAADKAAAERFNATDKKASLKK
jgi:hypothetical protein